MRGDGGIGVGVAVGQFDGLAALAEGFLQHGEAGVGDEVVAGEAQGHQAEVFLLETALGTGDFLW